MQLESDAPAIPTGLIPSHALVYYSEVGLKGKNRRWFENRLARNVQAALKPCGGGSVKRLFGRLQVTLHAPERWDEAARTIARVFGVAYVMPAFTTGADIKSLCATTERLLATVEGAPTFAVRAKRGAKNLPFTSMDIQRAVGARVQEAKGWDVDLDSPVLQIHVHVLNEHQAFVAFGRVDGPGGLPTGVSGRIVCLQSGGIDSPVAAYRMLKRGSLGIYVHFHSFPHTGRESQEKVEELVRRIHPVGNASRLYMVPFADFQRRIVSECPAPLRVILYRRFMVRVAARIARREKALALCTGESLGQVASQTIENLRTIDVVSELPILRPLIGSDKAEIVSDAKAIGTYDLSIEPHDDCCSFLMPPKPATHSRPKELEEAEAVFDIDTVVKELAEASDVITIGV